MKSWIARIATAKGLSPGKVISFREDGSDFASGVSKQDRVFIVDSNEPTILYGWGTVVELTREEYLVIGDDEEANTPPYPTYDVVTVQAIAREAFVLPLNLSAYLSANDFKEYEDAYGNKYGGVVAELPIVLADKLSQAIRVRSESGTLVFLSYASEDLTVALRLHEKLSDEGFQVWIDKLSLIPGQDWKAEIVRAIRASNAFVALLSTNSVGKRGYVQKELRIGLEVLAEMPPSRIYLIPVRAEPCVPQHSVLSDLHWLDLFPDFDAGVQRLVATIRRLDEPAG